MNTRSSLSLAAAVLCYFVISSLVSQIGVTSEPMANHFGMEITEVVALFSFLTGGAFAGVFISLFIFNYLPIRRVLLLFSGLLVMAALGNYFLDSIVFAPVAFTIMGAAGGVGTTAIELGKLMGAKVIAAASSAEKLALCKSLGADEVINYSEESLKDRIKELTGGKGVDVVYDPVGGDYAEPAIRGMAWNGRYLVIGFASGPIPKIPLNLTLLKGCSLVGVFWGRFAGEEPAENLKNIEELWELFAAGKISPVVTDSFSIDQYEDAFNCLIERRARGKVIMNF